MNIKFCLFLLASTMGYAQVTPNDFPSLCMGEHALGTFSEVVSVDINAENVFEAINQLFQQSKISSKKFINIRFEYDSNFQKRKMIFHFKDEKFIHVLMRICDQYHYKFKLENNAKTIVLEPRDGLTAHMIHYTYCLSDSILKKLGIEKLDNGDELTQLMGTYGIQVRFVHRGDNIVDAYYEGNDLSITKFEMLINTLSLCDVEIKPAKKVDSSSQSKKDLE